MEKLQTVDAKKTYEAFGIKAERWKVLKDLIAKTGMMRTLPRGDNGIKFTSHSTAINHLIEGCDNWNEVIVCVFTLGQSLEAYKHFTNRIDTFIGDLIQGGNAHVPDDDFLQHLAKSLGGLIIKVKKEDKPEENKVDETKN